MELQHLPPRYNLFFNIFLAKWMQKRKQGRLTDELLGSSSNFSSPCFRIYSSRTEMHSNRRYPSGSGFLRDSGFKSIQNDAHIFWVFLPPNGNKNGNKSH
jgi:hypothetical protein